MAKDKTRTGNSGQVKRQKKEKERTAFLICHPTRLLYIVVPTVMFGGGRRRVERPADGMQHICGRPPTIYTALMVMTAFGVPACGVQGLLLCASAAALACVYFGDVPPSLHTLK